MMTRDSNATYLHMHHSHHADLLESFTNPALSQLAPEDIYVPAHLQPVNPEDEDDVVPDQHAAFGIQRATQARPEPTWRDLGLQELLQNAPRASDSATGAGATGGSRTSSGGRATTWGSHQEPIQLALRRQPGPRMGGVITQGGERRSAAGSIGGAGNGLPR